MCSPEFPPGHCIIHREYVAAGYIRYANAIIYHKIVTDMRLNGKTDRQFILFIQVLELQDKVSDGRLKIFLTFMMNHQKKKCSFLAIQGKVKIFHRQFLAFGRRIYKRNHSLSLCKRVNTYPNTEIRHQTKETARRAWV